MAVNPYISTYYLFMYISTTPGFLEYFPNNLTYWVFVSTLYRQQQNIKSTYSENTPGFLEWMYWSRPVGLE